MPEYVVSYYSKIESRILSQEFPNKDLAEEEAKSLTSEGHEVLAVTRCP